MDDATQLHESQSQDSTPLPRRTSSIAVIAWGAVCAVLTVVTIFVIYSLATRQRLAEISVVDFERAREKWQANGPRSYDIQTRVEGLQQAVYRVEVRDGSVISATRNGSPLKDARTLGTWSVPGMFDTLEIDVVHAKQPIRLSRRESHYVTPLGKFDPKYGYPSHYRRIEWGSDVEASWEVTEFRVVEQ